MCSPPPASNALTAWLTAQTLSRPKPTNYCAQVTLYICTHVMRSPQPLLRCHGHFLTIGIVVSTNIIIGYHWFQRWLEIHPSSAMNIDSLRI